MQDNGSKAACREEFHCADQDRAAQQSPRPSQLSPATPRNTPQASAPRGLSLAEFLALVLPDPPRGATAARAREAAASAAAALLAGVGGAGGRGDGAPNGA
jgi:hypothetical protein